MPNIKYMIKLIMTLALKLVICLFLLLNCMDTPALYSQSNNGVTKPNVNQNIIVNDIGKADFNVKLPSLTNSQRDSLSKPEEGMVIFNSTIKKPQYFDGESWFGFHNDHFIGERFGGGIVFFVDKTGKHGLIAAASDQSSGAKWGFFESQLEANNKSVGGGKLNTEKIALASKDTQIAGILCSELILNGYDDWYLPSMDELNLMYMNLKESKIGNLTDSLYWSSSETDFNNAWLQDFSTGVQKEHHVKKIAKVRAIRAF